MYRVHLDGCTRQELQRRTRQSGLAARTRDRLEMVRLSDAGWSVPRIALHLRYSEIRVRHWIKTYLQGGFAALPDKPHPGQKSALTPTILQALREQISKGERIWTASQIADWLWEQFQLRRSSGWLRRVLRREGLRYKRTTRSLHHKQKPEQVQAKRADLQTLEKGGSAAC